MQEISIHLKVTVNTTITVYVIKRNQGPKFQISHSPERKNSPSPVKSSHIFCRRMPSLFSFSFNHCYTSLTMFQNDFVITELITANSFRCTCLRFSKCGFIRGCQMKPLVFVRSPLVVGYACICFCKVGL